MVSLSWGEEMEAELERVGDEEASGYFLACGRAYVSFGLGHPHLYRLMFGARASVEDIKEQIRQSGKQGPEAYDVLSKAFTQLVERGVIPMENREGAEFLAWSMVHGMVSLLLDGRGRASVPDPEAHVAKICETLIRGLSADK